MILQGVARGKALGLSLYAMMLLAGAILADPWFATVESFVGMVMCLRVTTASISQRNAVEDTVPNVELTWPYPRRNTAAVVFAFLAWASVQPGLLSAWAIPAPWIGAVLAFAGGSIYVSRSRCRVVGLVPRPVSPEEAAGLRKLDQVLSRLVAAAGAASWLSFLAAVSSDILGRPWPGASWQTSLGVWLVLSCVMIGAALDVSSQAMVVSAASLARSIRRIVTLGGGAATAGGFLGFVLAVLLEPDPERSQTMQNYIGWGALVGSLVGLLAFPLVAWENARKLRATIGQGEGSERSARR